MTVVLVKPDLYAQADKGEVLSIFGCRHPRLPGAPTQQGATRKKPNEHTVKSPVAHWWRESPRFVSEPILARNSDDTELELEIPVLSSVRSAHTERNRAVPRVRDGEVGKQFERNFDERNF